MKQRKNPIHRLPDWRMTLPLAQASQRCGAKTRTGASCGSPAMANGRCRMHGGASTGPRTKEGLERVRAASTKHGNYGVDARLLRAIIRGLKMGATLTACFGVISGRHPGQISSGTSSAQAIAAMSDTECAKHLAKVAKDPAAMRAISGS